MNILLLVLISAIVLFAALFLILEFSVTIVGHLYGAPYIRSRREKIKIMVELANLKAGETAIDLGSGDGAVVLEACLRRQAARLGAKAIGLEINPFLVCFSRFRIKRRGLQDKAAVTRTDFRKYDLKNADVIFLYLWPSTIEELKEKLSRELKPGARIVSNGFPIADWTTILEKDNVYLYRIPNS